jgi:hypothetical protein
MILRPPNQEYSLPLFYVNVQAMKLRKITVVLLFLLALVWGCKTTRVGMDVVVSEKENALVASGSGDFVLAVQSWEAYFAQMGLAKQPIPAGDYAQAAHDAFKAGNFQSAISWYDAARLSGYEGVDMYLSLAEIYRKQDNLSKELTTLQYLESNYHDESLEHGVPLKLFEIYMRIDKGRAFEQWGKLDKASQGKETYLNNYFSLIKELEKNELADAVANDLLKLNPTHREALEWNGEKFYYRGENRYQREMEKYNKNKTHVQYQFLLNELKIVAEDFKTSRDYFERLWELEKNSRYASFLSNIYSRLDNPERARFYKKLAE